MNHHDVGRGRGGIAAALGAVRADVTVAGITTDRLYPLALQEELARHLPGRPPVSVVESVSGHDGFLLEIDQVGRSSGPRWTRAPDPGRRRAGRAQPWGLITDDVAYWVA